MGPTPLLLLGRLLALLASAPIALWHLRTWWAASTEACRCVEPSLGTGIGALVASSRPAASVAQTQHHCLQEPNKPPCPFVALAMVWRVAPG